MRPIWHIISSFILGVVIFLFTRSLVASVVALLAGVFVDLDHLVDFWISSPENPFSLKQFYNMDKYLPSIGDRYTVIFLHGWEWVAVLIVFTFIYIDIYFLSFVLSVILHIALDHINNRFIEKESPFLYSVVYRVSKGFKIKRGLK